MKVSIASSLPYFSQANISTGTENGVISLNSRNELMICYLIWVDSPNQTPKACLDYFKISKVYKIFHYIEFCDT